MKFILNALLMYLVLAFFDFNYVASIRVSQQKTNDPFEMSAINFRNGVIEFCSGKPALNFCSAENLSLMFAIEDNRQKMMRMKNQIISKVFKIERKHAPLLRT